MRYSCISFCAKLVSISQVDFLVDIVAFKNIFGKSLKSGLSLFTSSFRDFSTFSKYDIVILGSIFTKICPWPRTVCEGIQSIYKKSI